MKPTRRLTVTLICLSLLMAIAVWWVTWPDRTAREFVQLMAQGQYEAATRMVRSADAEWSSLPDREKDGALWREPALTLEPRTVADCFYGRRWFTMETIDFSFLVVRGAIDDGAHLFHRYTADYDRSSSDQTERRER